MKRTRQLLAEKSASFALDTIFAERPDNCAIEPMVVTHVLGCLERGHCGQLEYTEEFEKAMDGREGYELTEDYAWWDMNRVLNWVGDEATNIACYFKDLIEDEEEDQPKPFNVVVTINLPQHGILRVDVDSESVLAEFQADESDEWQVCHSRAEYRDHVHVKDVPHVVADFGTVIYRGITYVTRALNGRTVADDQLNEQVCPPYRTECSVDGTWRDAEAEGIDNEIACYVPLKELTTLSDADLVEYIRANVDEGFPTE